MELSKLFVNYYYKKPIRINMIDEYKKYIFNIWYNRLSPEDQAEYDKQEEKEVKKTRRTILGLVSAVMILGSNR